MVSGLLVFNCSAQIENFELSITGVNSFVTDPNSNFQIYLDGGGNDVLSGGVANWAVYTLENTVIPVTTTSDFNSDGTGVLAFSLDISQLDPGSGTLSEIDTPVNLFYLNGTLSDGITFDSSGVGTESGFAAPVVPEPSTNSFFLLITLLFMFSRRFISITPWSGRLALSPLCSWSSGPFAPCVGQPMDNTTTTTVTDGE